GCWGRTLPRPEVLPLTRFGALPAAASWLPVSSSASRSVSSPAGSVSVPWLTPWLAGVALAAVPRAGSPPSSSTPTPFVAPTRAASHLRNPADLLGPEESRKLSWVLRHLILLRGETRTRSSHGR